MIEADVSSQCPAYGKILLFCGMLSSLLWIGGDLLAAMLYPGYSLFHQTISELSAIGAPTRSFLAGAGIIYEILLFAFGAGVVVMEGEKSSLRWSGLLIIMHAVLGLVSAFFPMNLRENPKTLSDIMHIIIYTIIPILILFIIWLGSTADGMLFRIYSRGTIVLLLLAGILTGLAAPGIAAGMPTPWVGVYERINVYGYMVWIIALAVVLLREEKRRDRGQNCPLK